MPTIQTTEPIIKAMALDDIPEVLKIEQCAHSHPWSEGIFKDCLHSNYLCYVLKNSRKIIGYGILSAQAEEAHILNICVTPSLQKKGWGKAILQCLLERAESEAANTVFLEVRESNHAAIRLYNAYGFNEIATRRNYYPSKNGRESALILAKELNINV